MNKVKNKDDLQMRGGSGATDIETLELRLDKSIDAGGASREGKDKVVKLKPAQQTVKSQQKSNLASQIGQSLQSAYNDILQQPVPDRFLELLRQLESGEAKTLPGSKKDNQ